MFTALTISDGSYNDYADEHWVTLGTIKSLLIIISIVFLNLICLLIYFFISCSGITESDIRASRRIIMKELLKEQILHKSDRSDPSAYPGLKKLSDGVSRKRKGDTEGATMPADGNAIQNNSKTIKVNK